MILDKYVEVGISGNKQYYIDKGYDIPTHINKDGKVTMPKGAKITVKVEDLPKNSHVKINVACDCCGINKLVVYQSYNVGIEKYGNYVCKSCENIHQVITNQKKYKADNVFQTDEVKQKIKKKNIELYGVEHPMKVTEIKEQRIKKQIETNMEKYNVPFSLMNDDIRIKMKETSRLHYGTDYPMQSPVFIEKLKKDYLEKYGVDWHTKIPDEIKKRYETLFKNQSQKTSSQQLYIHHLLGGQLNYPFESFFIDIFYPETNIAVEVDFGGHNLPVKTGKLTQEEFNKREMIRERIIRSGGIKIIRLISPHDKLPSDEKLLEIYEFAKEYFNSNHTWIYFYIEENKYRNAEHRDECGAFYDFGELRNTNILAKKQREEVA